MRSRRRNRGYTPPETERWIRVGQNALLLVAGLVTACLVVLAMMKGR